MERISPPPELFEQFAAGDLDAFESLFHQFQGEVYAWIVRMVRDPAAAEELTVETFWRIYRAHARFDASRSFGAWARRIATNVALDYLKRARIEETPLEDDPPASAQRGAGTPDPAVRREVRDRVRLALQQLPAKLRVVATLALIEDYPHAEIANSLNLSTAAVKSRVFRAVQLLRKKLGNLE
ncbi:MAG TPA: sigma-70 family RNA polymerase sigma factor [Candidatus Sulfotelmatobacter sp.]|nr:sigma-70 family RNA polymerase sigma factor [Candidatus Sulfotelmatobacter sp.]